MVVAYYVNCEVGLGRRRPAILVRSQGWSYGCCGFDGQGLCDCEIDK